jgi:hypothetical protein
MEKTEREKAKRGWKSPKLAELVAFGLFLFFGVRTALIGAKRFSTGVKLEFALLVWVCLRGF